MRLMRVRWLEPLAGGAGFILVAMAFFAFIGEPPVGTLLAMVEYAVGDAYSLSESLVKTTPILLCALAAIVPARLGLISVGAEGQLYFGALIGTALVLAVVPGGGWMMLPLVLLAGAAGGAAWGWLPGILRARLSVNETISTLLLNYIAVLLVSAAVYGPWKDPGNLGWPATIAFPDWAVAPQLFGTRVHAGLLIGVAAAVMLQLLFSYSRWGQALEVLKGNPRVGRMVGLDYQRQAILVMALGGAMAGLAGITETGAIQGRLQPGISVGYGLTGFLVAWLAGHNALLAVPISFMIGGLIAAGDTLQLFNKVPAASATVLQGLLFATALAVPGLIALWRARRG
ncbi:MAG: ABC transporter permease [Minwuia sp.]|uniref:ABC transporter permease n=1 Tax=Minwuia sp. TaxID=2493630 RepID=UPI003A84F729